MSVMKVAFILTMPGVGSWNGKFSGADRCYAKSREVSKSVRDKIIANSPYFYSWDDGWTAKIEATTCKDAARELKHSVGFMGYDWMIDSIIRTGDITVPAEPQKGE